MRTSTSRRTWSTYRRRAITSSSSMPNKRPPDCSTILRIESRTSRHEDYCAPHTLLEILQVRIERSKRCFQLLRFKVSGRAEVIEGGADLAACPTELLGFTTRHVAYAQERRLERLCSLQRALYLALHGVIWVFHGTPSREQPQCDALGMQVTEVCDVRDNRSATQLLCTLSVNDTYGFRLRSR